VADNGITVRIYRNNPTDAKLPLMVYFHGGGFALGSIKSHDSICRYLAKFTDCAVMSVEYSLAPESPYPAPVQEGLRAIAWLHRSQYAAGIDTSKIFLAGDSAGGTIALDIASDAELKSTLKGLILIYPTLDPKLASASMQQYATGHFLTKSMLKEFWSLYQRNKKYLAPTNSQLAVLPPVLVIAAEKDVLRDEGLNLVGRLRSLGREAEYECYNDMLHGFVQFPKIVSKKVRAFRRISSFVQAHL
jgi:acetyl esterase